MTKPFNDRNRKKLTSDYDNLDYQQKSSRKSNRKASYSRFEEYDNLEVQNNRIKDVSRVKNRKQPRRGNKREQKKYDIW